MAQRCICSGEQEVMAKLNKDSLAMVVLLGCITGLGPLSTDMYLASLPSLARIYHTDAATVQLTLSAFLAGFAVTQLLYGPLSDRFGRKPILLGGVAVFVLASLGCALAPSIEALVAWRFVQALGACAGVVLGRAVVRDLFDRERAARMMSMIAMALGLTPAVAPILGGYLHAFIGWQANFIAMAIIGLTLWLAVVFLLAESNSRLDPMATRLGPMLRNFATLLRSPRYRGYVACIAFSYGGLFAFISGSSFVLIGLFGVAETAYGYCFAMVVIGYISGALIGARLTVRFGVDRMLQLGVSLCALGGVLMATIALYAHGMGYSWHWLTLLLPMLLYTAGVGLTMPQAQAGGLQPFPQMAGSAAALMGFTQMTVAALVGIFVGHALNDTALPLACTIAAMGLLTAAAYWLIVRRAD